MPEPRSRNYQPANKVGEPIRPSPALRQRQTAAITHGLFIKAESGLRLRSRRVRRLLAKVTTALPWLTPADLPTARAWCEMEIVAARVFAAIEVAGVVNEQGEVTRLLAEYRQLKSVQLAYAGALGLSPAARMALKVSAAKSRAFERGDPADPAEVAALEARLMARLGVT